MLPNIVRYDILHPQKPTVLRELAKALDDPKRAVRKHAVEARYASSERHVKYDLLTNILLLQDQLVSPISDTRLYAVTLMFNQV